MNNLMIFEGRAVEVFEWNGKVLFNPKHVGSCLNINDVTVRRHIQGMNEKQVIKLKNSDVQEMNIRIFNNAGENFLTESGVYKLIFKSQKAEAEKFQDWVTDEVLPQIRATGGYIPVEEESNEEFLAKEFLIAQETLKRKKLKQGEKQLKNQKYKIAVYDMFLDNYELCTVSDLTKKIGVPRKEIFSFLREEGMVCLTQARPTQKGIDDGYLKWN